MNWLAHLYLSDHSPAARIGGLLPDMASVSELEHAPKAFQSGIRHHRQIDAFTDKHPITRRSIQRLSAPHRRYGGIIVDVFYDHFLSVNWPHYSTTPLQQFLEEVRTATALLSSEIPKDALDCLQRMHAEQWLSSYGELDGLRLALRRIGNRLRKPVALDAAVTDLEQQYDEFRADFNEFFPELKAHVMGPIAPQ